MRLLVRDGGTPSKTDTAVLYVHVNRNNFPPRFETRQYRQTVLETQALGIPFIRVQALDQDTRTPYNVLVYSLLGDPAITEYFMVDEDSGDIALKKSLMDDPQGQGEYNVS